MIFYLFKSINHLLFIYFIYPLDFPAKFIDEPSARSNTTIVFASDTPSGIVRALEFCPRATADKSTAIIFKNEIFKRILLIYIPSISLTATVKVFLSIN